MTDRLISHAILAALLLAPVLVPAASADARTTAMESQGPDLVVEEPSADLGELREGIRVEHSFQIRNAGDEALEIEQISASCGCTVAEAPDRLAPGETGTVHVELETLLMTGPRTSTITLVTNDPDQPVTQLELSFEVSSKLVAHPGSARWIIVQGEPEGTIGQTIWAVDGREFEILEVETPPHVRASVRPATGDELRPEASGEQWRVDLTLDTWAPVGPVSGLALVHTDHPEQELVGIQLSGFVRPTLFVEPPEMSLGAVRWTDVQRAVFNVRNFATDPIEITGADTDIDGVRARVEAVEEGRRYKVIVEFDPAEMDRGRFAGRLMVTTDDERVPSVTVPLEGELLTDEPDGAEVAENAGTR